MSITCLMKLNKKLLINSDDFNDCLLLCSDNSRDCLLDCPCNYDCPNGCPCSERTDQVK